ncbi:MAG: response regulator [Defluviitaleaceae bacterium]|nr:response regulator [Defluviitaleaceae bacterium]
MKKTIFAVDDNDLGLVTLKNALQSSYNTLTMISVKKMMDLLEKIVPDLILLDIQMPEIDGFEGLRILKNDPKYNDIPVVLITGTATEEIEQKALEEGAVEFVKKPFSAPILLNRIRRIIHTEEIIRERTKDLINLQNSLVNTLATIVETRDKNTGDHTHRVYTYTKILLKEMLDANLYAEEISAKGVDTLAKSTILHDIGKIAVPDTILNKPDKLTEEEFGVIKNHVLEGSNILQNIISRSHSADFLLESQMFAKYHHERWDGTGYPYGLKGTNIPLQGRILAIVDVFDALSTVRPYKEAVPKEKAFEIIKASGGTHFDPQITEVFYNARHKFM